MRFSFRGQARASLFDTGDVSLLGSVQSFNFIPKLLLRFGQFSHFSFGRLAGGLQRGANAFFLSEKFLLFLFGVAKRVNLCVNMALFFGALFRFGFDSIAGFQLREHTRF